MSYEILQLNPVKRVRATNERNTFIGEFDSYYTDVLTNLLVIDRNSGLQVSATPNHYYQFGLLEER